MKSHKYIYIVPFVTNKTIIFNGIDKTFFIVKNNDVSTYLSILKRPNEYNATHENIIKKLKRFGFLIDQEINEIDLLRQERSQYINYPEYKTTIVSTFECNYNCWYCVQKHEPVTISKEKIELIKKHVVTYLKEEKIKSYVLSWFGGEPLMQPDMIEDISSYLKQFCENEGIEYSSAITTNGALLSRNVILMLKRMKVNYYQIAIDGEAQEHNKIKKDKINASSFDLILGNIANLLALNENANVTLRINYTLKTLKSTQIVNDINKFIPEDMRGRLVVDLQKVWQVKEENIPIELLNKFQKELTTNGYLLCTNHIFSMCYVDKRHYNMIYYNGGVEKCDKFKIDQLRGYIDESGYIKWKSNPIFPEYDVLADDSICSKCNYYPLCYCDCPLSREKKIEEKGRIVCGYGSNSPKFEHRILDYCWRVINNNHIKV